MGPKNATFNIHEALLQVKTAFFEVHGEPNGETSEPPNKEAQRETMFKTESSPSTEADMSEPTIGISTPRTSSASGDSTSQDLNEPKFITADYHLDTHFVKAFSIFVNWLYNAPPQQPKTASQCKILIQAYLLALQYRAIGLQNLLLDCIRRYHIEHQINFDLFFIYLLNRSGDDVNCNLIKYFVDQIAYEITESSVEEFDSTNLGFENFLRERPQSKVRTALFHTLAKIATAGKKGENIVDPAVAQKHDYHARH